MNLEKKNARRILKEQGNCHPNAKVTQQLKKYQNSTNFTKKRSKLTTELVTTLLSFLQPAFILALIALWFNLSQQKFKSRTPRSNMLATSHTQLLTFRLKHLKIYKTSTPQSHESYFKCLEPHKAGGYFADCCRPNIYLRLLRTFYLTALSRSDRKTGVVRC